MTIWDAIILGLVEGVTEYLPISSTGHLILASWLLNLQGNEAVDDFSIIIQGGAILAVAGLFRRRVAQMVKGLLGRDAVGRRLAINLIVAFLPAAIFGVLLDDWIDEHLFHPGPVIGALGVGGFLLLVIGPWQRRLLHMDRTEDGGERFTPLESLGWKAALIVGLLQCVAMWPGTSRSMMTIVAGMLVGLRPRQAAEFSFLLGLPTLGGACAYKLAKHAGDLPGFVEALGGPTAVIAGAAAATLSAALAVKWLVAYLGRHGLSVFGWYRLALCGVLLLAVMQGWLVIQPQPEGESSREVGDVLREKIRVPTAHRLAETGRERLPQGDHRAPAVVDGV
jgi:undecaprenyl-diphosphatase